MTEIPNAFGGFAPFPNTIMIPTMGLQSAVIGYRFGFGYEQGKRAVRKMSNEEFNNLDEAAEQAMFKRHDSSAIDYFKTEMHNWVDLQNLIIEKSVEIEVMKAQRTPSAFREMFEGFTLGFGEQQKQDAKNFFAGLNDTLLKIMAFFSGHKGSSSGGSGGGSPPTFDACDDLHKQWFIWQDLADQATKAMLKYKFGSTMFKHFQQIQQRWQLRISAERKANSECSASWKHAGTTLDSPTRGGVDPVSPLGKRLIALKKQLVHLRAMKVNTLLQKRNRDKAIQSVLNEIRNLK